MFAMNQAEADILRINYVRKTTSNILIFLDRDVAHLNLNMAQSSGQETHSVS